MSPAPDPIATTATPNESINASAITARDVRVRSGAARSGAGRVIGRAVVGITPAIVGALCGFTAAIATTTNVIAGDVPMTEPVPIAAFSGPSLTVPSLDGRWSGAPYAIQNDASRCENGECKLVLDIVPCAAGWCGIEVTKANVCGGEAMQLKTHSDQKRQNAFEGKLSLGKDTQAYVIDANVQPAEDGRPATLEIVGDTGPEFRWFRRSFPFHAALTRISDAVCKATEKPVS